MAGLIKCETARMVMQKVEHPSIRCFIKLAGLVLEHGAHVVASTLTKLVMLEANVL